MALRNPSFEDAGLRPGEAQHWTLTAVTSLEVLAGFGPAPEEAWEDFERWYTLRASLESMPVVQALFDTLAEGHEDFEEGWANRLYFLELPPAQVVACPFRSGPVEHLESGWSNVPYALSWGNVGALAALFNGEPLEDFEEGWRLNERFATSWESVSSNSALFSGGAQPHEDFENTWPAATTL